jgi:hypothetical protein
METPCREHANQGRKAFSLRGATPLDKADRGIYLSHWSLNSDRALRRQTLKAPIHHARDKGSTFDDISLFRYWAVRPRGSARLKCQLVAAIAALLPNLTRHNRAPGLNGRRRLAALNTPAMPACSRRILGSGRKNRVSSRLQVRTGLLAGGNRIRTRGPTRELNGCERAREPSRSRT